MMKNPAVSLAGENRVDLVCSHSLGRNDLLSSRSRERQCMLAIQGGPDSARIENSPILLVRLIHGDRFIASQEHRFPEVKQAPDSRKQEGNQLHRKPEHILHIVALPEHWTK